MRTDEQSLVIESAEKQVISRRAIAGFYYFRRGIDFVRAARRSILNERHVQGSYFISSTLNELVLEGRRIGYYDIDSRYYNSLFSPQRIQQYERQLQNMNIVSAQRPSLPQDKSTDEIAVVIPIAGRGSRFSDAGYQFPKPFIDVGGRPMIERVIENLSIPGARYILVAQAEHLVRYSAVTEKLTQRGDVEFVAVEKVTEGAACTVLHARARIDGTKPLLIANCDQIVDFSCLAFVRDCSTRRLDGSILVFVDQMRNPKWSFARVNDQGLVTEVREKQPISDLATVGLYYFSSADFFINGALDMIVRNERVNNEFYVAPIYNYAIACGGKFGVYTVPTEAMHGIGTPEDLEAFLTMRFPS